MIRLRSHLSSKRFEFVDKTISNARTRIGTRTLEKSRFMPDPNALATLLRLPNQGGSLYNRTPQPYTPNVGRNPAKTGLLSRILGVPDDGSISQQEMQGAY